MAKLARHVGGGLDAVIAMTGHKDLKLADHYSKCNEDDQRQFSKKIMNHIRQQKQKPTNDFFLKEVESQNDSIHFENVVSLSDFKKSGTFNKRVVKSRDNAITASFLSTITTS